MRKFFALPAVIAVTAVVTGLALGGLGTAGATTGGTQRGAIGVDSDAQLPAGSVKVRTSASCRA